MNNTINILQLLNHEECKSKWVKSLNLNYRNFWIFNTILACCLLFCYCLPLVKDMVDYLNKLESLPSGMLWTKFAWKFFNHVILVFSFYHPLEMGMVLHLNISIPFIKGYIVPSFLEIGPVVFEKTKIWKVYSNINNNQLTNQIRNFGSDELTTHHGIII